MNIKKSYLLYILYVICSINISLNAKLEFSNKNALFNLKTDNAKLKISSTNDIHNWQVQQISSTPSDDTVFLYDNMIWESDSGNFRVPDQGFEFVDDLTIPDATVIKITQNRIIDGQGHSLTFGTTAQILIDTAVTLTLRNLTIKNNLSPISIPPIKCLDWDSKLVLENVKFALNDDFAFKTGQMYIYDDVIFTGSSKFIYQSVLPSYVQPHSTLYFDEQTTLDYSPSSTLKDLIVLSDESSSIYLNGATLQTTHTGIQLTKGHLLLENKVTLSSAANNIIYDLSFTGTPINHADLISDGDLDPSNRYLAIGSYRSPEMEIFPFDGNVLSGTAIAQVITGYSVNSVNWSPDGKSIALATSFPIGGDELQIYSFNNGSLSTNPIDSKNYGTYLYSANWHPSGKYIAIGGKQPDSGAQLQVYSFDNNALSANPIFSEIPFENIQTTKWHPNGKFIAIAGQDSTSTGSLKIYSFYDNTLSGTPIESREYGTINAYVATIGWSPDGNYLVIGGSTDGIAQIQIYSFYNNQLSASPISEAHFNQWSNWRDLKWSPNGKYISVAQQNNAVASEKEFEIFKVDNGIISSSQITGINYGYSGAGTIWTTDSKYLFGYGRLPFSGYELQQYEVNYIFDTTQQTVSNAIIFGDSNKGSDYNLDVSVLGGAQGIINGYAWYDSTDSPTQGQLDFASLGASLVLNDVGSQFKISNTNNISGWKEESIVLASGNDNSWIPGGITYGSFGPGTPPPARLLYHNSNAIVNISDDVTENSSAIVSLEKFVIENSNAIVNTSEALLNSKITENSWALLALREDVTENSNAIINSESELAIQNSNAIVDHTEHFASLNNGKLYAVGKISGETFINGRAILSSPIDLNGATLTNGGDILFSSQTTVSSSGYLNPQGNAYVLGGDLTIPDAVILTFTSDGIIDGQGHSLTFGTTAQILVDTAVTLTLRNLTIKNNLSPISIPPIKCLDWDSKLVLDNVKFALNDDFAFKTGQMYIHDDVIFTGSSKFIYQSVLPSYVQPHSTLYFDEQTTLDYSPSSTLKDLIVLSDESSSIYLNGATLQTTHTGMQLTKGRLILDNKVTLSGAANNVIYDLTFTGTPIAYADRISTGDLDPSNRYLAFSGANNNHPDLQIHYFDGNVLTGTPIAQKEIGYSIKDINWTPNSKNLALAVNFPTGGDELQIYSFDNGSLNDTAISSKNYGTYLNCSQWHPSGKHIAIGGCYPDSGAQLQIYSFDNNTLSTNPIFSEVPFKNIQTTKWHPNGKFIAVAGKDYSSTGSFKIYSFYDNTLSGTPIETRQYGQSLNSQVNTINWSPDGNYLAVGGSTIGNAEIQVYSFYNNQLSATPISEAHFDTWAQYYGIKWSPNGKYISMAGQYIWGSGSGREILVFKVDNGIISSTPVTGVDFGWRGMGTIWTADSKYLFAYGRAPYSGYELQQYEVNYMFDTTQQTVSNAIILGDSAKGSNYDLNSFVLGGARVEINGLAWFDDAS